MHQVTEGIPVGSTSDKEASLGIILTGGATKTEGDGYGVIVAAFQPLTVALSLRSHKGRQHNITAHTTLGIATLRIPSPQGSGRTTHTVIDRFTLINPQ